MFSNPRSSVAAMILVVGLCFLGCDAQQALRELAGQIPKQKAAAPNPVPPPAPVAHKGDTVKIASFNIQVFGTSKLNKPQVMDVLAKVVRRFDVVAIQEIRCQDATLLPNIAWVVSGEKTNTRRAKSYDNILFDRTATREYVGRWGVFDLAAEFGLTLDAALEVSDHLPVWAEFSVHEAGVGLVAARPVRKPR